MNLVAGARLGPYEILSPLGAGGMGEVYKARDSRLDRLVAVKVLSGHLTASAEIRQRFEREARTISSLSHPNICTLYDVGREGEIDFLVMELLDGQSLAQRLQIGPLAMEEVLRLGVQIADALEKAHASGVVHRDLKPGNVMLTERGVKLLDFGLAKLHEPAAPTSSATELRQLPTALGTGPLTTEGTLLGTFQYMAPEQLEGREADAASDIFALGAVLYEMATGRPAFSGKSQASLIGAIMSASPPAVSGLAPLSTPAFDRVVATCLAKDPRDRWQTAHDVRLQLAWIAEGGSLLGVPAPVASRRRNRERLAWAVAAGLALASIALAVGFLRRAPASPRVVRFDIAQPAQLAAMGAPKISPDGSAVAFCGTDKQARTELWVRPLDTLAAHPLAGTEGVTCLVRPFWSPDSSFLAYFVNSKLMKIAVAGGPPQKVADTSVAGGDGSWSEQGVILFDGSVDDPIRRVEAGGGVARIEQAVGKDDHKFEVGWPQFLPGGKRYLYVVSSGSADEDGVWLATLDGGVPRRLVDGLSRVEFAPPDSLLFVREATVVAQRFDADAGKLIGDPVPVAEGVGVDNIGQADFSASRNGSLAYRAGAAQADRLLWVDTKGAKLQSDVELGSGHNPALSPDGRWLAVDRVEGGNQDIWLRDLKRGVGSRFTTDPKTESAPLFMPDGKSVLFSRETTAPDYAIIVRSLDSPTERVLVPPCDTAVAIALTPDGTKLLYGVRRKAEAGPQFDLMVTDLAAGGVGKPYAASTFNEFGGAFSPDGHWLAFQSNESGRNEIYVQSFPDPGRKWQISTEGGTQPSWTRDGATLFYLAVDRGLMRVAVKTMPTFDAGIAERVALLALPTIRSRNLYVFSGDDQRLLTVSAAEGSGATPMTVVLNWDAARRK
ncbi:MAG: protein kinase [Acidobacteriota bacterium]